jgi:putative ABC transport system permease protein
MRTILLSPLDLGIAASLVVLDLVLSIALSLGLQKRIAIATVRMVVQLVAVGYVLRFVFALDNPAATFGIVAIMLLVAGREVAARPERKLAGWSTYLVGATSVALATGLTAILALTTAIRPQPWYDPRYALPLTGIILGTVLNAASITLDGVLSGFPRERAEIEARLALGDTFADATRPIIVAAIRRGMVPLINQMSAAGIVTLPGIMTGQILAGMDPLDAVKYQILLMFLLAGASGLVAVLVAFLAARYFTDERQRLRLDRLA